MSGSFIINGRDTYETWGVYLAEKSVEEFLSFPPLKDYIENNSSIENGVQVLTSKDAMPKVDAKTFNLVINISASSHADFVSKLSSFKAMLMSGVLNIQIPEHTSDVFHCLYRSCTQFSNYDGKRVAQCALRLYEPNPANRTE